MLKILDLFSGIGGFSRGLEKAGFETAAFCEIDPWCKRVLKKHWPDVPIFDDVTVLTDLDIMDEIDIICGGFPCQDISVAGKGKGLKGERSGLYYHFKRLIKEIRPKYVIIENVANLRSKGLNEILKDIGTLGYDCEWHLLSARAFGAPHLRERIFIIAYPKGQGCERRLPGRKETEVSQPRISNQYDEFTDTHNLRLWKPFASQEIQSQWWAETTASFSHWKEIEPPVCGVDDGLPRGLDKIRRERVKMLGNSLVPQIVEFIGREIYRYETK